ncbi:MAG: hypothetical protein U0326_27440 [Polyangiales bacterium]
MADPYIDPGETLLYGAFACEQMKDVCIGKVPGLDEMVRFAIRSQSEANGAMKAVLDRQPKVKPAEGDPAAEMRDYCVRFGKHIEAHRKPVPLSEFFGGDPPSVAGRRRLHKLVNLAGEMITAIEKHRTAIRDHKHWLDELRPLHEQLDALERDERAAKRTAAELGPEIRAARESWLAVYTANKALITGLLRHAGQLSMMPLIFDDLAEVHRVAGVVDAPEPTPPTPDRPPA